MGLFRFLLQQSDRQKIWKLLQSFWSNIKEKKKRQYDESAEDFTPGNVEDNNRINCVNRVVDTAIQFLQPRFEKLKSNHNLFGFLVSFKTLQRDDIRKFAESLEQALTSSADQSADICGRELAEKVESSRHILPNTPKTPVETLTYLSSNERYTAFPNYLVALRIFLTISITVASGKRSFSHLKLINNFLRSSIHEDRLYNLAILVIEHGLCRKQNYDDIVQAGPNAGPRTTCGK